MPEAPKVLTRGQRYNVRYFIRDGEYVEDGQYVGMTTDSSLLLFGLQSGQTLCVAPMECEITPVG